MSKHAVVMGSGIGGLGAALRLRAEGFEVSVFERRPLLGGKMHQVVHTPAQGEFCFDAGPSFLTQPHRLRELFALFGEELDAVLPIEDVDPSVHYFWDDGTRLTTPRNRADLIAELSKLGAPPERIGAYLDHVARQYEQVAAPFVDSDIRKASFWMSPSNLVRLSGSLSMLGRSFDAYNRSWFPNAPRLVQLLDRYSTYAGSNPYLTPAFMTSIADVELRQGIFYPRGGLRSVPEALVALGERHGVRFHTDAAVTAIHHDGGRVTSIEAGGESVSADVFVSAIDPQHMADLLGRPRSTVPRALSALIWFWGVEAKAELGLHNIFFSEDYRGEFDTLQAGSIGDDLTIYINASSTRSPEHAPEGHQNWFVMINAPADNGQDWAAMTKRCEQAVRARLERNLGPLNIVSQSVYTPLDIAATSGAFAGAIYGPASDGLMHLLRKQPPADGSLKNLFYCGGSCHPGGGIPMCLSSAGIAVRRALAR